MERADKFLYVAVFFACLCNNVFAVENGWMPLTSNDGVKVYYRFTNGINCNSEYTQLEKIFQFANGKYFGNFRANSVYMKEELNTRERSMRIIDLEAYSGSWRNGNRITVEAKLDETPTFSDMGSEDERILSSIESKCGSR